MIYVLVEAGEGETETIIVGSCKDDLIAKVKAAYEAEIESSRGQKWYEEDNKYLSAELIALTEMLESHDNWTPGEYILETCKPIWQQWTLHIEEIER